MRRRQFLATTTSMGVFALSGCLSLGGDPTSLGSPDEEMDANGLEKHLVFRRDSEDQVVITINQRRTLTEVHRRIPFRLHVWHRDGLSIDRLHFKLRSPPHSAGPPADVYLQVPDGGPWPPFEFRTEDSLWSVISVDEIGRLGDGSLTLDLIVDPISDPPEQLAVRAEVDLSESGLLSRQYRARTNTEFDILRDPQ